MNKIMVALDITEPSETLIQTAKAEALAHTSGVILAYVLPPEHYDDFYAVPQDLPGLAQPGISPAENITRQALNQPETGEARTIAEQQLNELKARFAECVSVETEVLEGLTAQALCSLCEASKCSRLIVGSHGHGSFYKALIGSVSEGILEHACCPVLIVPV